MANHEPTSTPPKPDAPASIYSYQTRLMRNANETSPSGLSRMQSLREDASVGGLRRSGSGARFNHTPGGKSIGAVRGQWEAKIEAAAGVSDEPAPPPLRRPKSFIEPKTENKVDTGAAPTPSSDFTPATQPTPTLPAKESKAPFVTPSRPGATANDAPQASLPMPKSDLGEFGFTARLGSMSGVTPNSTGTSTMRSNRSAADTLAEARANALRRLEAKKKAGIVVEEPKVDLPPLPVAKDLNLPPLPILDASGVHKGSTPTRLSKLLPKTADIKIPPPVSGPKLEVKEDSPSDSADAPFGERLELKPVTRDATPVTPTKPRPEPSRASDAPETPFGARLKTTTPKTKEPVDQTANAPATPSHRQRLKSVPRAAEDASTPAAEPKSPFRERKLRPTSMFEPSTKTTTVEEPVAPFAAKLKPVTKDEKEPPISLSRAEPEVASPTEAGVPSTPLRRKGSVLSRVQNINNPATPKTAETQRVSSKDDGSVLRRIQSINKLPESVQTSKPVAIAGKEAGHIHRRIQSIDQMPESIQTSKPVSLPGRENGHILRRVQSIDHGPMAPPAETPATPAKDSGSVLRKVKSINQLPESVQTSKPVTIPGADSGHIHRRLQSLDQTPPKPTSQEALKTPGASAVLRKVRSIDQGLPMAYEKDAPSAKPPQTPGRGPRPAPAGGDVFSPAKTLGEPATPSSSKPKASGLGYRAPTAPPKGAVAAVASRWANAEAGVIAPSRGRIPSLSSDRRRLGKHLPRIVSGDQGWDGDSRRVSNSRVPSSAKNRKTSLSRSTLPTSKEEENTPPRTRTTSSSTVFELSTPSSTSNRGSERRPLTPSSQNRDTPARVASTPRKQTVKSNGLNLVTPRREVHGEEMKGLMSAVGAASARTADTSTQDAAAGMPNRLRLSSRLPLAASSAAMAPAPLPSRRLAGQNNWMDRQRHVLGAYEYLCHVGEAQQWIEGCLDEELEFGVTEMEEGLRDGVVLAKLARVFQGEEIVKRIWTEAKHRFRQSDNINYFLNFVRTVGMPETFIFELTDLYNAKNIPKVIFCIHVLSHLLARLGRTERMNNLVGQFEFTEEQLAATEKGIQGVSMPNFQSVGQTLAKEASWDEPEEEEESEDEKRDRELLEREPSIAALQCHLRGALARQRITRTKAQLKLATPIIVRLQAQTRGQMSRRTAGAEKQTHRQLRGWATKLQAASRAHLTRRHWTQHVSGVKASERPIVGVQAHARGMLVRMRIANLHNQLDRRRHAFVGMQAFARGRMVRRAHREDRQAIRATSTVAAIIGIQSLARGRLARAKVSKERGRVEAHTPTFVSMQSHLRGALIRRQHRAREKKMDDATDYVVAIQAAARGLLARRRKKAFVKEAVQLTTSIASLQAIARGRLAKRQHANMQKALAKVEVAGSVGGLQAFLRTRLAKHKTVEQKKKLEFVQPDVIGFQAMARGYLARQKYNEWREYLVDPHTQGALVFLQSLIRGFICRRNFWMRRAYLYHNQDKITKVQALWRGRTQRQMYQRLITGGGVDVPTVQNYMHLLDDTETDFGDQLRIDTLRKEVVELLRTNQSLETEVGELDTKIALILKNKMTFEELARAKRRRGVPEDETFHQPGGGDPFVGVHLDRTSQRKLELFEHLFFTLQTQPQYLSRLLWKLGAEEDLEKDCRLVESVTLILFGFGHDRREEYLFHKLCQVSMHEQVLRARSLEELANTRFSIISVVNQYVKPALTPFLHNVLVAHVQRILQADMLDLSTDPVDMYNRLINAEESLTGVKSTLPRDLDGDQVLQSHADTRTLYIQHLQELRALTDFIAKEIMAATALLPYTIRLLAREALLALRVRFPECDDRQLWPVVAKAVIMPFILPAIVAPETYGIAEDVNPIQRRNLAAIANLLSYVAAQDFSRPDRMVQVPLNEYIRVEGYNMGDWILDVAEVDFQVQEMVESTTEATPISITRSDIYGLLGIMMRQIPALTAGKTSDPIQSVLEELEGPPLEYDRSNKTVRVRLTNRLAELQPSDPEAARLRELEVQAKRHVIAVLRIQTGKDLYDVLLSHPTEADEQRWIQEVHRDIALEQARLARHDLPPTPGQAEYQMESIRSLPFHEVKARAVEFCMALVEAGVLSREDHFQGLLVSIASDIREKHRLRQKRKVDLRSMSEAHAHLSEKRQNFEEQVQSYHDYIDTSMAALQQKKKAPFMSKQFWHQRGKGKKSKFGSYKYTAAELYEKGILLSVNQFSPRQFDKIQLVIGSDAVGVFTLEMTLPTSTEPDFGREELRMEDLLQAQFDNNVRLDLFDGSAAFNLNTLIHQINKKFYAS